MNNYVSTKANWMLWCMENKEGFVMIGSRKINQLNLEANMEFDDLNPFNSFSISSCLPMQMSYELTGSLAGFTMVTGKTEFEAFITLMHTFQEEERKEKAEKEAYTARVKDEKKLRKIHKKNKKAALEGKFDHAKCLETCYYCIEENNPYDNNYPEWYDSAEEY